MALAVVQVTGNGTGGSSQAVTFGSTTTAGNFIIAVGNTYADAGGYASGDVADNKGNTYTLRATSNAAGAEGIGIWSAPISTGGASHQVTFTSGASATNLAIIEISGQDATPFDKQAVNSGSWVGSGSRNCNTGSSGTLAQAAEIAIVGMSEDTGSTETITATGYTNIHELENGGSFLVYNAAYGIVAATTAIDFTWAITSGGNATWHTAIATFKEATAAGTSANAVAATVTTTASNPTTTVVEAPDAPTGLTPTAGSSQVGLTWTAPADDGGSAITDYVVQYRVTP